MIKNTEVEYKVSTHKSKYEGYQSKKGNTGSVKAFISNLWYGVIRYSKRLGIDIFDLFVESLITIYICERFCLERAFQRIRIKGGACNPCCVQNITLYTTQYLFDYGIGISL